MLGGLLICVIPTDWATFQGATCFNANGEKRCGIASLSLPSNAASALVSLRTERVHSTDTEIGRRPRREGTSIVAIRFDHWH
jgi:hypothetical protein